MATARFVQAEPVRFDVELVLAREEASDLHRALGTVSGAYALHTVYTIYTALGELLNQSKKETTTR